MNALSASRSSILFAVVLKNTGKWPRKHVEELNVSIYACFADSMMP